MEASIVASVERQLGAAGELMAHIAVQGDADAPPPSNNDVAALKHEGKPWTAVAELAVRLRALNAQALASLASIAVMLDGELRWRLFHLAVLGEVLAALRELGATKMDEASIRCGLWWSSVSGWPRRTLVGPLVRSRRSLAVLWRRGPVSESRGRGTGERAVPRIRSHADQAPS